MRENGERTLAMVTFGCRVNQFESALLKEGLSGSGFVAARPGEGADLVVVNTCSVTAESDRQARQAIRRARREHPGARIVVTGCYAQRAPDAVAAMPGVDWVVGNPDKGALPALLRQEGERLVRVSDADLLPPPPEGEGVAPAQGDQARAHLQVQTGCDEGCTFCLIPRVRGPSRSFDPHQVANRARELAERGFRELVLTGINLGSYGRDLSPPSSLGELVASLAGALGDGVRLRLSSLDPMDLEPRLVALLGEGRVCPHLHLSVQSGDSLVLKRMHRRHDREQVLERVAAVRRALPGVILGADLIVGFPTESEEAFANTLSLVAEAELALLHVFRYSDRPGTPAAAIPRRFHVSEAVARERSARLRRQGEAVLARVLSRQVGGVRRMLVEEVKGEVATGKCEGFLSLCGPAAGLPPAGGLAAVRVAGVDRAGGVLEVLPTDYCP